MNDLPEQPPNVDYGPDNDIPINGRNEKEYDVPGSSSGLRLKRSVNAFNKADNLNKMLPKVSASGKSIIKA